MATLMADVHSVAPARKLRGTLTLPGDKSISHRALMLALLADGETRITGAGDGEDVRSTAGIVEKLGARVQRTRRQDGNVDYVVKSKGAARIDWAGDLWCGNSGTTRRLFAGLLAGLRVDVNLDGDDSLRSRPMGRVIEPLRAMGADIEGPEQAGDVGDVAVVGTRSLHAIDWTTPVASAQVKSAILLAGLEATGTTVVRQSLQTRDHTERMLRTRGVAVRSRVEADGSSVVEIDGPATVKAVDQVVPGDPSAAAFWLVAATIHQDAEITLRGVGVNPSRRAVIDLLERMGASIDERGKADDGVGEPIADLVVESSDLEGIELSPADTASAIDEIPILCLAATQACGSTVIRGAGELRHKESDRIAGIVDGLTALGATISADGDDIVIEGPTELRGATVDSLGDHRLALTFAIAGLVATGRTTIRGADSVAISYPTFFADLERIRA
ncbi:MAG TPA: 3-phosphoshikimate 1-carboxyvinyltransferase [Candidatus Limnocylindrales bacterium]|nr:3-phosphoshikimate 1-carboxyvinyltransferase [Candidatus Limnocylindrales bacterium]